MPAPLLVTDRAKPARRKLGLALAMAGALALVFVAALMGRPVGTESALDVDVTAMPARVLSARAEAGVAWIGDGLFVWGGRELEVPTRTLASDGAILTEDPVGWRSVASSPLEPRAGAAVVWTGDSVLVWGGSGHDPTPDGLQDGALYRPAADTWRSIAPSPVPGRTGAFGTLVGEGQIAIAGGTDPVSGPRATGLLWYDLADDSWSMSPTSGPVYDFAASDHGLALATIGDSDGLFRVDLIDPSTHELDRSVLVDSQRPTRVGLVWHRADLLVTWTRDSTTYVSRLSGAGSLERLASASSTILIPPVDTQGSLWPQRMFAASDTLVMLSLRGIGTLDLATGDTRSAAYPDHVDCPGQNTPWVVEDAVVWVFGGDRCTQQRTATNEVLRIALS